MGKYVLTDGKRYIHQDKRGQFVPTSDFSKADLYNNEKAKAILCNQVAKPLRRIFYLKEIAEDSIIKPVTKNDLDETEVVIWIVWSLVGVNSDVFDTGTASIR